MSISLLALERILNVKLVQKIYGLYRNISSFLKVPNILTIVLNIHGKYSARRDRLTNGEKKISPRQRSRKKTGGRTADEEIVLGNRQEQAFSLSLVPFSLRDEPGVQAKRGQFGSPALFRTIFARNADEEKLSPSLPFSLFSSTPFCPPWKNPEVI